MCGRFVLHTPPDRLARLFDAALAADIDPDRSPRYNIAPTNRVLAVADVEGTGRIVDRYRWGLVPSWAKDLSVGQRMFNARSETAAEKPSFRSAFKRRRVVVPADGFYEWDGRGGGKKVPHYFTRKDGEPLAFAGLWEIWHGGHDDEVRSCTILTTSAGSDIDGIHDRMPVILERSAIATWLDPKGPDEEELADLLASAPAGTLRHHPVGVSVGSVRNDGPELIEPIEEAAGE